MKTPQINEDLVQWLQSCFDTTGRKGDTNEILRWKAAQREVVDMLQSNFELQRAGQQKSGKGFKRKSVD